MPGCRMSKRVVRVIDLTMDAPAFLVPDRLVLTALFERAA